MNYYELFNEIKKKRSYLCIGLDTDINKIPQHLKKEKYPLFEFNRRIIDATAELCVAYKPNTAFYESLGSEGWENLEMTLEYIPDGLFTICDAKRGDIGNTSKMYADAFFKRLDCDAVTINPYMGKDSVDAYLDYRNKWAILLGLTSNQGSQDFELLKTTDSYVFEEVIRKSKIWGTPENLMYVVGANRIEFIHSVRKIIPDHFLLIPGVGAQGGSLEEVSKYAMNGHCGMLVNSSRSIIYASDQKDYYKKSKNVAIELRNAMSELLDTYLSG
jgi:orotidine-5'-phosphate decarboxylase